LEPTLPDGYGERPLTDADLDAVVRLVDDADRALGLDPDPIREFLTWIWHLPSTDLERDTRLVVSGTDVACFAQGMWNPDEGGPLDALVRVHPDHVALGLGSWSLAWTEALAAERGSEGVRMTAPDLDVPAHALLTSRGYAQVRSFLTMGKELFPGEDAGPAPAGVAIRAFEADGDEHTLHEVHESSFADHWGFRPVPYETFAGEMYEPDDWDPSLAFLAEIDGQAVGHVVALSFEGHGYIAVVGVLPAHRGRGIAKSLLRRAFGELATRGLREVRLGVDAQNSTGAVALYEGVGMTPLRAYDTFELGTPEAEAWKDHARKD